MKACKSGAKVKYRLLLLLLLLPLTHFAGWPASLHGCGVLVRRPVAWTDPPLAD